MKDPLKSPCWSDLFGRYKTSLIILINLFCLSNNKGQNVAEGQHGKIKIPVVPGLLNLKCVIHFIYYFFILFIIYYFFIYYFFIFLLEPDK